MHGMAKTIQIRSVPEGVHEALKVRAAAAGLSLSDYILRELEPIAAQPIPIPLAELFDRLRKLPGIDPPVSAADLIREMRGPLGPE
jgi:plasmid stability protein